MQKYSLEVIEGKISSAFSVKCVAVSIFDERLGEDMGIILQEHDQKENHENNTDCVTSLKEEVHSFLQKEFSLKLVKENILIHKIPLSSNGKYDRLEAMKLIINNKNINFPIDVQHLKNFMPHRGNAIWVHRIISCDGEVIKAEVDLDKNGHFLTTNQLRASACIEIIAQAYGYGVVAKDVFGIEVTGRKSKTLIAEIRDARFFFKDWNNVISEQIQNESSVLSVEARCTHQFGQLRVIKGTVKHKEHILAEVGLKAFVGE